MRLYSHGSDVLIAGAGVIGLSLALELCRQGAKVAIYDRGVAGAQTSAAAAGMLAVGDPHNPSKLRALAELSAAEYPAFLGRIEALAGQSVPWQTERTRQTMPGGEVRCLAERSLDPRQLLPALRAAVVAAGIRLHEQTEFPAFGRPGTGDGAPGADQVVYTTGPWTAGAGVLPRKGQMLRVRMPAHPTLHEVYRSEHGYIVPRTRGPQAGTALVGATVEDAGFNLDTDEPSLRQLRETAADLVPQLADPREFPAVEAWAGIRPGTPDDLPVLGRSGSAGAEDGPASFVAAGHFRNGILLAPGTALCLAALLAGRTPPVDLDAFSPQRFSRSEHELSQGRR